MPTNWSQYTLNELKAHATRSFRNGGGTRPDVLLIEIDGQQAILKDHNSTDRWFALFIGPLLAWRECKALKKLASLKGIPDLLAQPDRRSFLMSYHPSEQVTHLSNNTPDWPIFFTELTELISQVHRLGIAHNDLRNPTNTLVTPEGRPVLVDLVACFCRGANWNMLNHYLFDKFCQVDLSAITKIKSRVAPSLLHDKDVHAEQIAGKLGMRIRGFGQWVRRVSRKIFTNKTN